MKVVINKCFGGFGLSDRAIHWLRGKRCEWAQAVVLIGEPWPDGEVSDFFGEDQNRLPPDVPRTDHHLVRVVEELGEAADGCHAHLKIVEVPEGVEWHIEEYDGVEWVAEAHRTWA